MRGELLSLCEATCDMDAPMSALVGDVRGVLAEAGVQPFGYAECELVVPSALFAWVPEHLYDASHDAGYLEALAKIPAGCGVYSAFNEVVNSHMIFAAPTGAVSAFKIAIPGLKVRCQHNKMVCEATVDMSAQRALLLMHFRADITDFAVLSNRKLQMSNSYPCAGVDEALYYALNVTKEFRLEESPLRVALCGEVDRTTFGRIRPFFPEVVLYTGEPLSLAEPEMQHLPLYRHALILS